jgi:SAM-dependent methyltransferase
VFIKDPNLRRLSMISNVSEWYEKEEHIEEMRGWDKGKLKIWEQQVAKDFPYRAKILDIGCGIGREAFELIRNGIPESGQKGSGNKMCTRRKLAKFAEVAAQKPFHGYIEKKESNLEPIVALFPKWNIKLADKNWCAAFVYYCCIQAGFQIPYSPNECISCSLAGCGGWEDFAIGDKRIEYHPGSVESFVPEAGDIVIYDRVFINVEHDHIGIVLENKEDFLVVAEGNTFHDNISRVLIRDKDEHIRAYIRIPDHFNYFK